MIRPSERQTSIGFWVAASVLLHGAVLVAAPVSLPREVDPGTGLRVTLEAPRPVDLSAGRQESQQPPTQKVAVPKQTPPAPPPPPERQTAAVAAPPPTQTHQPLEPTRETRPTVSAAEPEPEVMSVLGEEPPPTVWLPRLSSRLSGEGSSTFEEMCLARGDVPEKTEPTAKPSSSSSGESESRGGLSRPQGISLARPDYPEESRVRGEEGTVTLRVLVDTDGRVAQVKVAKSSGSQQLDRAAVRGARRWRFEAARRGGVAIDSWVEIGVVFRLEDATG